MLRAFIFVKRLGAAKMKCRGWLFLSVSMAALVAGGQARAADLVTKAPAAAAVPASWTGFYVGVHAGASALSTTWGSGTGELSVAGLNDTSWSGDGAAPIVGAQVGYNYQVGNIVMGVELDASAGQMNAFARCLGAFVSICTTSTDWMGTLTARLGYAFGNSLIYAKAGGALADSSFSLTSTVFPGQYGASETALGWTVGGGIEMAVTPQVSVKAEYAYMDFGSTNVTFVPGGGSSVNQTAQAVKLGLNWRPNAAPLPGTVAVPAGPVRDWSGLYVGAHAGGAWARNDWTSIGGAPLGFEENGTFPGAGDAQGLMAGVQAGFNVQMGNLVAGLEATASVADIDGYAKCAVDLTTTSSFTCRNTIKSMGLLAARLGWAAGDLLVYGKAGAVWADADSTLQPTESVLSTSSSGTRWGWMAGAGVEYALGGNLSAFAEYNHMDFGSQSLAFNSPVGPLAATLDQQVDAVRLGLNYRFGASDGRRAAAPPAPPAGWTAQVGARWFASTGRMQKDLYDDGINSRLNSRLIYGNTTGQAGETFFRFDTDSRWFLKGYAGLGSLAGGSLYDEDFPAGPLYSNTISSLSNGRLAYGALDVGYDFISQGGNTLGAFIGYRALYQAVNGYGCTQVGLSDVCNVPGGPVDPAMVGNLGLSETELWQGVAIGLNARMRLSDKLKLEVDAAYLPYAVRSSFDNHWFRSDINPQAESGYGWGTQLEAVLTYAVTDRLDVGLGGRYWFFTTEGAGTQFPGATNRSPQTFFAERYGAFLQASYRFGDLPVLPSASGAVITKAPRAAPVPTNWTGFYAGGTLGGGKAHTTYDNVYAAAPTGNGVDLGGALAGGQIGADYQFGQFVVGAEATAAWANLTGTDTCFAQAPLGDLSGSNCGTTFNGLGTVTGRLGYAFDRALVYARGGFAWARQTDSFNLVPFTGTTLSNESTNTGWTVGVGLEYALLPNLSVGLEYKHYSFGGASNFTTTDPAPLAGVNLAPADARIDAVAMTLNWRFDPMALRP